MKHSTKLGLMFISIVLFILCLPSLTSLALGNKKYSAADKSKATALITTLDGRSGGTGVILKSSFEGSDILTNKHVCQVVKNGGVVRNSFNKPHLVQHYIESDIHDLCLIHVAEDLGITTDVASRLPFEQEKATVSGHPHLYPTLVTEGYFGSREIITVMIGLRPCTKEDLANPMTALSCLFRGGLPILKEYSAQIISALIMPGSSGSAVYNSDGEIQGLVFAGSGGLGFGYVVPIEFIVNFLRYEVVNKTSKLPKSQGEQDSTAPFSAGK